MRKIQREEGLSGHLKEEGGRNGEGERVSEKI